MIKTEECKYKKFWEKLYDNYMSFNADTTTEQLQIMNDELESSDPGVIRFDCCREHNVVRCSDCNLFPENNKKMSIAISEYVQTPEFKKQYEHLREIRKTNELDSNRKFKLLLMTKSKNLN